MMTAGSPGAVAGHWSQREVGVDWPFDKSPWHKERVVKVYAVLFPLWAQALGRVQP
ncbi:hypothetical protein GIR22_17570 [Pseudomonas sp. CCM 7891]|uniref:Uncharacterized protein n=1 Tax=Pseudomonas karstica TaxID=1055468 RepID=A0A7X2RVP9_9PSED|nr:hypothetical protein [Pseudomonas karstica]MTD20935.1 hypothetical protein [Pseudomonas karstica]